MAENNQTMALPALPADGRPPKCRIANAEDAADLVYQMWKSNEPRRAKWQQYQGSLDGNPPYPPTKLRNRGEEWRANINFLGMKSLVNAAKTPYYDLFSSSLTRCKVCLEAGQYGVNKQPDRIVNEELDVTLKMFPAFDDTMQRLIEGFVGGGRAFLYWDHPISWMPRAVPKDEILFPDRTSTNPDEWEAFAIIVNYPLHKLWKEGCEDEKTARSAGWKPDVVRDALITAVPKTTLDVSDWMEVQRQLKESDLLTSLQIPEVQTAHLFTREFDGRWSMGIIVRNQQAANSEFQGKAANDWLFHKPFSHDNVRQIIAPFYYDLGRGSMNGIEGLTHDAYSLCQLDDRLTCNLADNGFLRMTIPLQARTANAKAKANLVVVGGITFIPPGFEAQQASIFGDMTSGLELSRELSTKLERNTGVYRPQLQAPSGNPRTLGEVQLNYSAAATLSNSAVGRFYNQLDWAYTEIYRRIAAAQSSTGQYQKAAVEFQDRCEERGVAKEQLRKVRWVRASRSVGSGSAISRSQAYSTMFPLAAAMPEEGRQAFFRAVTAANLDYDSAAEFFPQDENIPDREVWEANVENGQMIAGVPAVITGTQNHSTHLTVHVKQASDAIASLKQGGSPEQVLLFLSGDVPHSKDHLALLSRDPMKKDEVSRWKKTLNEIEQTQNQIAQLLKQQQDMAAENAQMMGRVQAIQQGVDPKTQIKAAETGAKVRMSASKNREMIRQKAEKHALQMKQMAEKAALSNAIALKKEATSGTTP